MAEPKSPNDTECPDLDVFIRWSAKRKNWVIVFSGKVNDERLECAPMEFGKIPTPAQIEQCKGMAVAAFQRIVDANK